MSRVPLRRPTARHAAVSVATAPVRMLLAPARQAVQGLVSVVLICALVCWLFWQFLVPGPVKSIVGWGVRHIDYSCASSTGRVTPDTQPIGDAGGGLVGMSHAAGAGLRTVATWQPNPKVIQKVIVGSARMVGMLLGAFQSGAKGQDLPTPPPPAEGRDPNVSLLPAPTAYTGCCPGTGTTGPDLAARAVLAAGATGETAATLVAIAGAESSYNPHAVNPSSTARGLWQEKLDVHHLTQAQAFDPDTAARVAVRLHAESGWQPWAESRPMWAGHMVEARAAVARAAAPCLDTTTRAAGYSGGGVLEAARSQLGTPYLWGGEGPSGFDCSGLTQWAYEQVGVTLPRTAEQQRRWATPVRPGEVQPGDLVFFQHAPGQEAHHVGLVSGGGNMIDAPHTGAVVTERPIYGGEVITYGRVPTPGRTA